MEKLPREFYECSSVKVASDVLGMHLVRCVDGVEMAGRIVESEAYGGADDPASYAYKATPKSKPMFGRAGVAYIVPIHAHNCFNTITDKLGAAGAVLIRAVEPLKGIDVMRENRKVSDLRNLTNGPGKLTQAMAITRELEGVDLTRSEELFIRNDSDESFDLVSEKRVGVKDKRPWRFYIKGSGFVSGR